jgi:hypothetical protein
MKGRVLGKPARDFVRDEALIVAGLAGRTSRQWLFVGHLWVRERLRGRASDIS